MPVGEEVLESARRQRPQALSAVLTMHYPFVYRVAAGLLGDRNAAMRVTHRVLRQSLRAAAGWTVPGDEERWFWHHTLLTARRSVKRPPTPSQDALVTSSPQAEDSQYVAFVRAIRALPDQQREAFLLHTAEGFDRRKLAITMDCSQTAAETHLSAADRSMREIAGDGYVRLCEQLARAQRALTPTTPLALGQAQSIVRRHVWPRRLGRAFAWLLILTLCGGVAWFAWWIYPQLDY